MHRTIVVLATALLCLVIGQASAADLKPLVINPSTGLQQQLQPGDRLKVPTAAGGFFSVLDPGVQASSPVFSFPVVASTDTLVVLGIPQTFSAKIAFPATTTSAASITLPHGTAPSSPINGDLWSTTAGFFGQVAGATVGPFGVGTIGGTLTSPRVPFASGASTLTDDSHFTYAAASGLHVTRGTAGTSLILGTNAGNGSMSGTNNTIIGEGSGNSLAAGNFETVIGEGSLIGATGSSGNIVIGVAAANTLTTGLGHDDIVIGNFADVDSTSRQSALIIGGTAGIVDTFIGNGITNAAPGANTIHGTGGNGTDIAGAAVTLAGGQGTGAGVGGAVVIQTAPHSTTGSGANALAEVARFTEAKDLLIGTTTEPTNTGGALSVNGETYTSASTTTRSGLNVPHGSAPTAPVNGDLWTTTAGFFGRVNGVTVGPFSAGSGSGFPVSTSVYAVQDATDATKQQLWNLASQTTGINLTVKGQQSTSQTIAFPNVTGADTLAVLGLAQTFTAKPTFPTATTSIASMTLPHGVAPTSPVNGDLWTTTSGLFARINGSTVGPYGGGTVTGALTSGRVPFANGSSSLTDSANLTYATAGGMVIDANSASTALPTPLAGRTGLILGDGTSSASPTIQAVSFNSGGMILAARKSGGSRAAPAATPAGSSILTLQGYGWDTAFTTSNNSTFAMSSLNLWSATDHSTIMTWSTTPGGSTTNGEVMRLTQNLLIGTTTDPGGTGGLTVTGETFTSASTTTRSGLNVAIGTAPTAPANGDIWNDSSQLTQAIRNGGLTQSLTGTICTTSADGVVTNTAVETTMFGTLLGTKTLPANFLKVGKTIRLHLTGLVASTGTPTIIFKIKIGTAVATSNSAATVSALAVNSFVLDATIVCRSTGASGTILGAGLFTSGTAVSTPLAISIPNGTPVTLDTTSAQTVDVTATWSAASPSDTITAQMCTVEILN